ncbi:MAG: hypothetical protein A2817_00165 [Candidatus Yanofskybacteria bacterium RIFCSPHIGHO2_01_FULL_39_8b]|uniref:Uncharacterized protein n=1 Tax=Candidatus Yanofskybacteria bacterium RIFCSPHIGHO2_01_FULL_39_8b TaxID=1802659 RepID=A0A1F8EFJ0_9BACT|nr:MAG: hypothetical protein A2817_00165 [Candidatus Yanofskybacteria bacterium RIFCSPHIGHO2_01_FULL_39_8b]
MLIAEDIPLASVRKIYGKSFPGTNPHHLVPRSRNGSGGHFNLFPYNRKAHSAYHHLFWNLKIDEVWNNLDKTHQSIFDTDRKYCYQWWISSCFLDKGTEKERERFEKSKQERLVKLLPVSEFKKYWIECFGNNSVNHARLLLKYMMLFMIFGVNMADTNSLFNNDDLTIFFETSPSKGYRLWAFEICFGSSTAKVQTIKTKISKVLKKAANISP